MGIDTYLTELARVLDAMPREPLEETVDLLLAARERDATIFVIGNGGSAATASHIGNDLNKLTIVPGEKRFRCLPLTDNVPLVTAWANDNGYETSFVEPLRNFMRRGDVVIGISTSGNSGNVVCALEYAKREGAATILFGGSNGGGLCRPFVDVCVLPPTEHQGMQEDMHLIFNHAVANVIRDQLRARVGAAPLG